MVGQAVLDEGELFDGRGRVRGFHVTHHHDHVTLPDRSSQTRPGLQSSSAAPLVVWVSLPEGLPAEEERRPLELLMHLSPWLSSRPSSCQSYTT